MRVAWLGLGIMGSLQAAHLVAAGHELTVWNRTRAKADAWAAEHGATVWQEANVNEILLEPSETDDLPRATGVVANQWFGDAVKDSPMARRGTQTSAFVSLMRSF